MSFLQRNQFSLFSILLTIGFVSVLAGCQPGPAPTATPDLTATIAKQTVEAALAQGPTSTPTPVEEPTSPPRETARPTVECQSFSPGDSRYVGAGNYVIGDVIVDGKIYFDMSVGDAWAGYPEGTVVFLERPAQIIARWGAACKPGVREASTQIVEDEMREGCDTGCASVRFVVLTADGRTEVTRFTNRNGRAVQVTAPTPTPTVSSEGPWLVNQGDIPETGTEIEWLLEPGQVLIITSGQIALDNVECGGDPLRVCVIIVTVSREKRLRFTNLIPRANWIGVSTTLDPEEVLNEVEYLFWTPANCLTGCTRATVYFVVDDRIVSQRELAP